MGENGIDFSAESAHDSAVMEKADIAPGPADRAALERLGVRGEVRGTGRSVGWANETWVNLPEDE